jgi:hypothetical protein
MTPFSSTPEMSPDDKFLKAMGVTPAGLPPGKTYVAPPYLEWPVEAQNRLLAEIAEPMGMDDVDTLMGGLEESVEFWQRHSAAWERTARVQARSAQQFMDQRDALDRKLTRCRWSVAALGVAAGFLALALLVEWTNR